MNKRRFFFATSIVLCIISEAIFGTLLMHYINCFRLFSPRSSRLYSIVILIRKSYACVHTFSCPKLFSTAAVYLAERRAFFCAEGQSKWIQFRFQDNGCNFFLLIAIELNYSSVDSSLKSMLLALNDGRKNFSLSFSLFINWFSGKVEWQTQSTHLLLTPLFVSVLLLSRERKQNPPETNPLSPLICT